MTDNTSTTKVKRNLFWAATATLAGVLVLGGGVAYALINQNEPEPQATIEPAPVLDNATPTPTPPAAMEPVLVPVVLPDDCREIYTPEHLELWKSTPLNDESLAGVDISRHEAIESIREALPGLECIWGVPTEGGMSTAVNEVGAEREIELIAAARDSGFTCEAAGEGVSLCQLSETVSDEDEPPKIWTNAEELYFRDGLVVTTWRASTVGTMTDSTQPVYDTLWP